jgi:hypothetical protein
MKNDEFEQRLQRQPFRAVPEEWRSEILQSAHLARCLLPSTFDSRPLNWWRAWLWPNPRAWAGLAAAWAAILVLIIANRAPEPASTASLPAPSNQILLVLTEQRRMLAKLIESPTQTPAAEPNPAAPKPRSQRRLEFVTA